MSGIVLNEDVHVSKFLSVAGVDPGQPRRVSVITQPGLIKTTGSPAHIGNVKHGDLILLIDNRR